MDNRTVINSVSSEEKKAIAIGSGVGMFLVLISVVVVLLSNCRHKSVSIVLYESRLSRENANQTQASTLWNDIEMQDDGISYTTFRDGEETEIMYGENACYSNEQIKQDAAEYKDKNLGNGGIYPDTCYQKSVYVENVGNESLYVRITVLIPAGLDEMLKSSVRAVGGDADVLGNEACSSGEWQDPVIDKYADKDGKEWVRYSYVRADALNAGEMTYWSPWSTLHMDKHVSNEDVARAIEQGWINQDGEFNIIFNAEAIQSREFESADEAFEALDG